MDYTFGSLLPLNSEVPVSFLELSFPDEVHASLAFTGCCMAQEQSLSWIAMDSGEDPFQMHLTNGQDRSDSPAFVRFSISC